MEYGVGEYVRVPIKRYPPRDLQDTRESRYWRQFRAPVTVKEVGSVTSIEFSSQQPHKYAVTSATRVLVYDGATRSLSRTYTRFRDKAYSGTFRDDGRLLAAGGEEGVVQVFDAESRSLLRQLRGHLRPVHVARFSPSHPLLMSGGDDATVRLWDITAGQQVLRLDGHTDYVRAAAINPASADVWATGGYDHCCKLWDTRSSKEAMTLSHGAPIESLAFFQAGSLLVTAGGTQLCVWDVLGGGRLLHRLTNHQKTVTSVVLSRPQASSQQLMLSASLDGHVKAYDLETFKVTHASRYPAPILSLALSPDCGLLAVGMADGLLSVRRRAQPRAEPARRQAAAPHRHRASLTAASYRYFVRGQGLRAAAADHVVAAKRRSAVTRFDRLLRRFRYRQSLDAALETRRPEVVSSVVEELAARGGLGAALAGRDPQDMLPLVAHLRRHLVDPRHALLLASVAHRLLDTYSELASASPELISQLGQLLEQVRRELQAQEDLLRIRGMLEPLMAAALPGG